MTNFRNLKIVINDQQPLDEVVKELERLGYVSQEDKPELDDKAIIAIKGNYFGWWHSDNWTVPLTTLTELKEM